MESKTDPIGSTIPPPKHDYTTPHFMAGYLPNWLIELKHSAHMGSSSNFAALIPALLLIVVEREGWSRGKDESGETTRTVDG